MKKIAALGLAAAMAATATLAVTASADAKTFWPGGPFFPHHNFYPHHNNGFFFGFSFGPQFGQPYPYRFAGNLHVQWCASHYKTYNPYTNTFFIKKGVPAVCYSPYWH
ncbi:MAG TPA: BA14K family protein [Bauldia sp.]|nr:BA14K family protein [Bauldia sp.]